MKRLFAFSSFDAIPNGIELSKTSTDENVFMVVPDMEAAHRLSGVSFDFVMIDQRIDPQVQTYLQAKNRWRSV